MARQSLKSRMENTIQRSRRNVFLRRDFARAGGYDQVGRVMRILVADGTLMKLGYGLYAKARLNRLTGRSMLVAEGGFNEVAQEVLNRLGVKWTPAKFFKAYQDGATQIPANTAVIVSDRFNRKIETDRFKLQIMKA